MHPAIRTQVDGLFDVYSVEFGLDASDGPGNRDMAHQEFKKGADITEIMKSFGVFSPQKQLYFGEVDYSIDLQQALGAIADAKAAWQVMPPDVKKEFRTWQELLNALESGQIKLNEGDKPIVTEPLQTGGAGAAQST